MSVLTKAGYCFRCDAPAEGEVCPRCGAALYREQDQPKVQRPRPISVGEAGANQTAGVGPWAIVAIVVTALLLVAIAVVAASAAGVS